MCRCVGDLDLLGVCVACSRTLGLGEVFRFLVVSHQRAREPTRPISLNVNDEIAYFFPIWEIEKNDEHR